MKKSDTIKTTVQEISKPAGELAELKSEDTKNAAIETSKEDLQATIEKLTLQLNQANIQLDQYTYVASHEFQEPLRKIVTFSKILQQTNKKLKPAEVTLYLEKIEASSTRLKKLIEEMLNFSQVTNYEKLLLNTDLNIILQNALFDLELRLDETHATVDFGKLPKIEAVPFQMGQLFYDIMHNSLKFINETVAPTIKISSKKLSKKEVKQFEKLDEKLTYYQIIFKDNGIGFDQKYAEKIFTMFQRLSSAGQYPGTGVGLSICKKVVQTHYGEIFAVGIENEGAEIHVILPLTQPKKLPEDVPTILKTWL